MCLKRTLCPGRTLRLPGTLSWWGARRGSWADRPSCSKPPSFISASGTTEAFYALGHLKIFCPLLLPKRKEWPSREPLPFSVLVQLKWAVLHAMGGWGCEWGLITLGLRLTPGAACESLSGLFSPEPLWLERTPPQKPIACSRAQQEGDKMLEMKGAHVSHFF